VLTILDCGNRQHGRAAHATGQPVILQKMSPFAAHLIGLAGGDNVAGRAPA